MPDINSLPPSRSTSGSPSRHRHDSHPADPSSRSSSVSLAAAATINASMHSQAQEARQSPSASTSASTFGAIPTSGGRSRSGAGSGSPQASRLEQRRSAALLNINLSDPALPGPGELQGGERRGSTSGRPVSGGFGAGSPQGSSPPYPTADPHHQRAPSLGELHQELEAEQEAQVNRLLQMIRTQQIQLSQMQQATGQPLPDSVATAVDDSTPTSERSFSLPSLAPPATSVVHPRPRSPAGPGHHRGSHDLSRQSSRRSRTPSRTASPSLRPLSASLSGYTDTSEPWTLGGSRDESSFYQAETQMLTRENQMLRMRIRELERQVNEASSTPSATSAPATVSNLTAPPLSQDNNETEIREDIVVGEPDKV
ncbi:MAG: hypothetical protein M1825_004477 [Sarcosagium campestre]|nr:MAG: hypothetical protein M1825_004477 [Sarcosagium campestre]